MGLQIVHELLDINNLKAVHVPTIAIDHSAVVAPAQLNPEVVRPAGGNLLEIFLRAPHRRRPVPMGDLDPGLRREGRSGAAAKSAIPLPFFLRRSGPRIDPGRSGCEAAAATERDCRRIGPWRWTGLTNSM